MHKQYPSCVHIKRPKVEIAVNNEIAGKIGREYRVMPIFEKGLYEHTYKQYYSLHTNEYLKCRWLEYKRHYEDRVFAPFQFVDIRDYHFYKCKNRLIPSENFHTKTDHRMKLQPGPGVDFRGQMPIPQELLIKRGTPKAQVKPKRYSKEEPKDEDNENDDNKKAVLSKVGGIDPKR